MTVRAHIDIRKSPAMTLTVPANAVVTGAGNATIIREAATPIKTGTAGAGIGFGTGRAAGFNGESATGPAWKLGDVLQGFAFDPMRGYVWQGVLYGCDPSVEFVLMPNGVTYHNPAYGYQISPYEQLRLLREEMWRKLFQSSALWPSLFRSPYLR